LTAEYEKLQRVFGWGREDFLKTNLMAVEAAFLEDRVKRRLRKKLIEFYPLRGEF
jgi:adenosine deaminase